MAKRKREKQTFRYECSLTGEKFTLTQRAENADELISVEAYYEMNPEEDDRGEAVSKQARIDQKARMEADAAREAAIQAAREAREAEAKAKK